MIDVSAPEPRAPFFVAGGTVPPGSPSYVERAADRELYEALLAGEFCHVLNSRQMGKSSLAVRTIARLKDGGVRTAFVDLTRIGGATVTPEQWYAGLLLEAGRALGLRAEAASWLREHLDVGPAQRLLGFLQEFVLARIERPVVLMLDEIDAVRSLGFSTDELFAGLRQLHNGRASDPQLKRLTVCLLGAALPSDLIRDPRTTPFNVGRRVELRDFTSEEARPFAAVVGLERLVRLMHWTGGHPFLTQVLGAELAADPSRDVDALVRERYLDARARESDTNLTDVARRLLGEGDPSVGDSERADTLSLYERMLKGKPVADDEANPSAARIKMSGVARVENGNLKVRNRIYAGAFDRRWVRDAMPGQELRRQRRAFWRGALRTGLVSVSVLAVVSALAVVAMTNAKEALAAEKRANEESDRLTKELYVANMGELGRAWGDGQFDRANELLQATKGPGAGWEWEYWSRRIEGARLLKLPLKGLYSSPSIIAIDASGRQALATDEGNLWSVDLGSGGSRNLGFFTSSRGLIGYGVSANGRWLVYPAEGGRLVRRDLATGKDLAIGPLDPGEKGERDAQTSLVVVGESDDGTCFLEERNDPTGRAKAYVLRRTKDGSVAAERTTEGYVTALSPDGRTVLAAEGATGRTGACLREIDVATGATRIEYPIDAKFPQAIQAGYVPGGRWVWSRSDGRFLIFERGRGEPILVRDDVPRGEVASFSRDGKMVYLSTQEPGALLIDIPSGVSRTLPLSGGCLAPDGKRVWTVGDGLAAYDLDRLAPYSFQGRSYSAGSPQADDVFGFGNVISSRDADRILFESSPKTSSMRNLALPALRRATVLAPDGRVVARFPADGEAWTPTQAQSDGRSLDLVRGEGIEIRRLPDFYWVRRIARVHRLIDGTLDWPSTSADGRRTLFVDPSGRVVLTTRMADGSDRSAALPDSGPASFLPRISPNGRWGITRRPEFGKSGDRLVYEAWDLDRGSKRMTLGIGFQECVWTPDGDGLLTFALGDQIKSGVERHDLLRRTTFRLRSLRQGIFEAQLSPDGSRLAYATAHGLWLVEASTGRELLQLDRFVAKDYGSPLAYLAFGPDGRLVASMPDGTFRTYRGDR